ncbi:uncharacterized protein LOC105689139 isoform X2 [Athalia rosae]|uniref:uncharacterized protein LOC105689139 isoform X2 n=1 Tax=Athalia rosae TaxID=37344 RepID=UPI00203406B2|nr:uncharacterized protein LOC105689139 isoform X2 [Athalia rosae]
MMSNGEGVVVQQQGTGSACSISENVDMATSTSASAASLKPRSGKISFSVDSLLSGTRRSPGSLSRKECNADQERIMDTDKSIDVERMGARYRELLVEQQRLHNQELLVRLSPHRDHQGSFVNHQRSGLEQLQQQSSPQQPTERRDQILTVRDFSRTSSHEKSSAPSIRISLAEVRDRLQQDQDKRPASSPSRAGSDFRDDHHDLQDDRIVNRSVVSPAMRREFDDRSDSEANKSVEGDRTQEHLDEENDVRSVGHSEDLNVTDSDSEIEKDPDGTPEKEKSSPVVPQPIHPGVQRPPGTYLGGPGGPGWNPGGFPHSLAGFAWLPPPPHPHNPHGHLYPQHGGPTSPNGENMVSKSSGQGETSPRSGNRETEIVGATAPSSEFRTGPQRFGTNVSRCRSPRWSGIHSGSDGQTSARRCRCCDVHGASWAQAVETLIDVLFIFQLN